MPPATGHNVGRKIAELVGEQVHKARTASAKFEQDQRAQFNHDFSELLERELAPSLQSLFGHVLEIPDLPEPMRDYFTTIMYPQHQANVWLMIAAVLGMGLSGPGAAAAGLIQRLQYESMKKWGDTMLTPQESAVAVVKGHVDRGYAGEMALYGGMHDETFQILVDSAGNPPGPQTLITMLNRGIIDAPTFLRGIAQGLIRDEWALAISDLRYGPPTPAEAIAAEVEGHLDADSVKRIMRENSLDEKWHDVLYATFGLPPGIQEMLQLLRRGIVDQATVEQAVRESHVKDKYIPAIIAMQRHLMPERTVVSAISKGIFTHAEGVDHLLMLGFSADDAAALASEATSTKMGKHKEIAESQVVTAYEDGMASATEATSMIEALGYTPQEASFILTLADHKRDDQLLRAAVSVVRSKYVARHIDNAKASNSLDALGVAPAMRSRLLKLWESERADNVPRLTVAQWTSLFKKGIVDDTALGRAMLDYGYSPRDAGYLVALAGGDSSHVPPA